MVNPEPIVIRPEDVKPRPETLPEVKPKGTSLLGGFNIGQIREIIAQVREVAALLDELGLSGKLKELGINLKGGADQQPENIAANLQQAFAFLELLKQKYGDVPISKAIELAKAELKAVAKK